MALTYPDLLPGVFAAQAADHEDIPDTNAGTGRMAWDVGFPEETSMPEVSGGVPPRRLDMNGLGNRLSQHTFWQQSGGLYTWTNTLDYPAGAHILGSNGVEYIAVAASGPSITGGAVDPTTDVNFTRWKSFQRSLVDIIYPIGSIYMSVNPTSPATLFGGTWQQIQGRFMLSASTNYPAGTTGGSMTHALTTNEMPQHTHTVTTANAGGHVHTATIAANGTHSHSVTVNNGGAHTHSISVTNGAQAAGAHSHTISINNGAQSAGAHTHTIKVTAQEISGNTGYVEAHSHSVTYTETTIAKTGAAGDHKHTRGTMNITGSYDAFSLAPSHTYPNAGLTPTATGAFGYTSNTNGWADESDGHEQGRYTITFDASKTGAWTGSTSENGNHTHSVTVPAKTMTSADANRHRHSITINVPAQTISNGAQSAGAHTHNLSGTTASVSAHTHNLSGTTASGGTHNHTASTADAGSHTHTITVANNGVHTHTVSVGNAGGNAAFNIMPSYFAVNVWQRTA